jgi:hypothetical protein
LLLLKVSGDACRQALPRFGYSMRRLKLSAMLRGTGEPPGSVKHSATASASSGVGTPRRRISSFDSSNSFSSLVIAWKPEKLNDELTGVGWGRGAFLKSEVRRRRRD